MHDPLPLTIFHALYFIQIPAIFHVYEIRTLVFIQLLSFGHLVQHQTAHVMHIN